LTYTKPCLFRPLLTKASACALIFASVGERRTKLQLLQPIAGRTDWPLSEARAAEAGTAIAVPAIARAAMAALTNTRRRSRSW
jgi:hypothetical protein